MAVTVVDAPITTADVYPGAITVSGTATGLIVAVGHSVGFGDASGPSSVSMGGQSLTQIGVAEGAASSGHDVSLSFWALNETKIAAASNTTLSFSGGNQTGIAAAYFTVAGSVDVETLSASGNISTGTTGSVSLARSADSLTFACSLHDNASLGFSNLANPAEDNEITATNIDFVYGVEADTARTVDFTWDNLSSRNNSTLALSITASGAASPTVSAADDITSEGDTAEFTLSGNSTAPISATLNGTDVGTLTLVSGSTYSYTAPLIADDDTANLVVTVDSTTTSTVISYANSYPYELVTHGEPDANSIFFDAQFATTGPVEWGVVTDYDSAVVTVDHAAMDAAEDELNDVDLHSTEVAAGNSTATYKYFVPESGSSGTFQATITVDGTDEAAPTISSVDVPTAGSYKAGDDLDFTVNWDESVDATGTPQLAINVGGTTRQADYVSGDGTTALVFTYTVQAGDNDANGISVTSMALNGGSIQDAATNNADLTLNNVGDTSAVLVDTVKPVITVTGQNPYTLVVGETYTDPGATASDDQDGSLGSVTGTGSVDDETIGQYTITYPGAGVVDTAGNVADDATRTVNVVAEDAYPYSKGIKYAATKTWEWGKRHPKTGMRVRMFK